jgi:phage tail sheath protein FI
MLTSLLFSSSWAQQPAAKQRRVPPSADHYAAQAKYLEQLKLSLQKGTSFAVFEPNNEKLWGNVRQTVQNYLFNEWKNGALLGDKPEQAYFVKCDRTTMSQNDLDNGRLIVLVGVAQVRPAEFVTFRIVQLTANHGQAGKRPVKKN